MMKNKNSPVFSGEFFVRLEMCCRFFCLQVCLAVNLILTMDVLQSVEKFAVV